MAAPERPDLVAKQELEFQRDAVLKTLELLGTEKNSWYEVKVDKIKFRNRQAASLIAIEEDWK